MHAPYHSGATQSGLKVAERGRRRWPRSDGHTCLHRRLPRSAGQLRQNRQQNRHRHQTGQQQPPPTTPNRQTTTRPEGTRSGQGQRPREAGGANATPHIPMEKSGFRPRRRSGTAKNHPPTEPCGAAMAPPAAQRQVAQPRRGPPERPTKPDKNETGGRTRP